ncbi:MAG: IS66 family insertion sequence element accessory protein TnpB [Bacteroides xylanisolvens]
MLGLNPSMRFYLCEGPVDMRKGIFTLAELVRKIMGKGPPQGTFSSF